MSETKIDRIPSQRNDATKTAIALIVKDDSSKLIVRAFRWQDEWYDVRKIGDWEISKLDMSKTKLFDTVAEARVAAGISYLSSPPGKKLATIYGERFAMFSKFDTNDAKSPDLRKSLKCPADAVYEFVEDNSFHVYYYEDEKPNDASKSVAKIEAAAKALEHAAGAIKSTEQASIVSSESSTSATRRIPVGTVINETPFTIGSDLLDRVHVVTPDELRAEVARKKEAKRKAQIAEDRKTLDEFKATIRTKIHRRLAEELSERFSMQAEIVFAEPAWHAVNSDGSPLPVNGVGRQFPWNAESNKAFMEVVEEFKQAGWECSTTIGYDSSQQTEIGYNRIVLKINPCST